MPVIGENRTGVKNNAKPKKANPLPPPGNRTRHLTSLARGGFRVGLTVEEVTAAVSRRNEACCHPSLSDEHVKVIVNRAAREVGVVEVVGIEDGEDALLPLPLAEMIDYFGRYLHAP